MSILAPSIASQYPQRKRWTGEEFDRASLSGLFDGQSLELVDGQLLEVPPMNDPHAQAIQLANYALLNVFPPAGWTIRVQCPMRLGESRPLLDFVVVPGIRQVVQHPATGSLIIEVSDTTLEFDRTRKGPLYARHELTDYWIINLNGRCVEVYRSPIGAESDDPRYGETRVYDDTAEISPLAAPRAMIRVADLLP